MTIKERAVIKIKALSDSPRALREKCVLNNHSERCVGGFSDSGSNLFFSFFFTGTSCTGHLIICLVMFVPANPPSHLLFPKHESSPFECAKLIKYVWDFFFLRSSNSNQPKGFVSIQSRRFAWWIINQTLKDPGPLCFAFRSQPLRAVPGEGGGGCARAGAHGATCAISGPRRSRTRSSARAGEFHRVPLLLDLTAGKVAPFDPQNAVTKSRAYEWPPRIRVEKKVERLASFASIIHRRCATCEHLPLRVKPRLRSGDMGAHSNGTDWLRFTIVVNKANGWNWVSIHSAIAPLRRLLGACVPWQVN